MVTEDFGLVDFPWHCWEDLVVDRLPAVDYLFGSRVDYSYISLVGYLGLAV